MEKIDFVVLWVDGADTNWLKEKNKYSVRKDDISNLANRYRDWDLLKYWFRAVEKNASWVNKIHFVTWGHIPEWLDTSNSKLNIVKHEDFIPKKYLPTFNSNVIQFYLNRIKGLSDKFVMFDDDMFILKKVREKDFFRGNKICDNFSESVFFCSRVPGDVFSHSQLNNLQVINKYYSKKEYYKKNIFKIFSIKNGFLRNAKTLSALSYGFFVGIYNPHICQAYTKKHYDLFWKYCKEQLEECSNNRFRGYSDLTTFLIRHIELLEGDFVPRNINFGKRFEVSTNNTKLCNVIRKQKYSVICVNDSNSDINFETSKKELKEAFETLYSEKSSFEK